MIAYLKGNIINKTDKYIILLVSDIGYEIFLPNRYLELVKKGEDVNLYIYHKQREDSQELYGFEKFNEREFFIKLISVSGVGPKSALNVLSMANVNELIEAIVSGNADMFKKVSGIGQKTAERIVIELKNKFGSIDMVNNIDNNSSNSNLEVFEALITLGFSDVDIRSVYGKIPKNLKTDSEKIKAALKLLKK